MEFSNESDQEALVTLFSSNPEDVNTKIQIAKQYFETSGSAKATREAIQEYTSKAFAVLEPLNISEDKKELLRTFGSNLMNRTV